MVASPDALRPVFASETLLDGFDGQPPFLGCGISADITATALATLNEALVGPNGWPIGRKGRTDLLKRGWRAFERVFDANGMPDRDDLIRIHQAMFPGLPEPTPISTRSFSDVIAHLDAGNAISIATLLSALPPTAKLRQYTAAPHQFTMWDREGDTVRRQDPMHPHSSAYRGERVPLEEVEIAAKAIEDGDILYWLYPIGGWTAARLRAIQLRGEVRELRRQVARRDRRIARLEQDLAACRDGQPVPPG